MYKITYNLTNEWKKSEIKIKKPGVEEVIFRNGISFEDKNYQASISIVHRIILEPNITVRKFALSDHKEMIAYLKSINTSINYLGKWEPYRNIKGRENLSYMSIYYYLVNDGYKTYIKDLYIYLGDSEFYVISFNASKKDYISDTAIKYFLDSINFISIKNKNYEGNENDYFNNGLKLKDEKNYDDAVKSFEIAIEIKNNFPEAYYEIAQICYYEYGMTNQAISDLKTALNYKQDYSIARCELANIYWNLGNEKESIKELELAIKYSPDYYRSYYNLGIIYLIKSKNIKAEKYIKKAIELKSDFASAHYNLGIIYGLKKNYKKAIDEFILTLKYDSNHAKAYYNLGFAYENLKQIDLSLEYYNKCLDFTSYFTENDIKNINDKINKLKSEK